ncbi:MAG: UDP-N-acetylmuramoyl-L-alanine--D-glutamate ligase [Desulfobulbaceae bacterium]|nr:UDP-N-acetylmuramoyl-L-alanine--D-glutamate ligase [Desulfobulbaceae bacterium]
MNGLDLLKHDPSSCKTVVVGSGKSGFAALKLLHRMGSPVFLSDKADKSTLRPEFLAWLETNKVPYETGGHGERKFLDADLIVVSPGVPLDLNVLDSAGKQGVTIIGEMGLAAFFLDIPVVAVTGTNGKTTVTELIGTLIKASGRKVFVGGNIGTPLAEYLLGDEKAEIAVLEVSSYQLDTGRQFKPRVALLLNISPDHLDRYPSYAAYADSKMAIFANQDGEDAAILNCNDVETMKRLSGARVAARKCFFGCKDEGVAGAKIIDKKVEILGIGREKEVYRLPDDLKDSPNCENAMAALLAARLVGCPPKKLETGLASFHRLPHRLTKVAEVDGVTYYDDSKATNIGAVISALNGMEKPVVLIAGGRDKGGDYAILKKSVGRQVKKMLLIGEASEKMASALGQVTEVEKVESLEEAVTKAAQTAESGDVVLLSPACASFDMFKSYEERGNRFQKAVLSLKSVC